MYKYIPIFYFFFFSNAYLLNINNDKIAVIKPDLNKQFKLNNLVYRESINPVFTLNLKKGSYQTNNRNIKLFDGKAKYGKPYLKDILIKPEKLNILSKVTINTKKDSDIYVLATVYNIYPLKNSYNFFVYHNNKLLYEKIGNKLEFFTVLKTKSELNIFSIYVKSSIFACVCPSIGSGYDSGYQLATWVNISPEKTNNYTFESKIIKIRDKISSYSNNTDFENKSNIKITILKPIEQTHNYSININSEDLPVKFISNDRIFFKKKSATNIFSIFYKYFDISNILTI